MATTRKRPVQSSVKAQVAQTVWRDVIPSERQEDVVDGVHFAVAGNVENVVSAGIVVQRHQRGVPNGQTVPRSLELARLFRPVNLVVVAAPDQGAEGTIGVRSYAVFLWPQEESGARGR